MIRLRGLLLSAGSLLGLAASAVAAMPPVLDRVPDNALVVFAAPSADAIHKDLTALMTAVEFPFPIPEVNDLLSMLGVTGGIDTSKSIALVVFAPKKDPIGDAAKKVGDAVKDAAQKAADDMGADPADEDEDVARSPDQVVLLLPISKYEDLLTNFGTKPGAAGSIDEIAMPDGNEGFLKDVGGGYAALSDDKELLAKFEAKSGASALKGKLGKGGETVADTSGMVAIVNVDAIRPMWPELKKDIEKAIKDGTAELPMGDEANPFNNEAVIWFLDSAMRDGRAIVGGMKPGSKGFNLDLAITFTEGSYMGKIFEGGGKSSDLLTKLPAGAYIMAGAIDTTSKGLRQFFRDFSAKSTKPGEEPMMSLKTLEASEGSSFVMGLPKGGVFGGLMTGMLQFNKTADGAAFLKATKEEMTRLGGKVQQGMTVQSTYVENGAKVDDIDVDVWDMKLTPDDSNQMAAQGLGMIFGPSGGPNVYLAKTDGGVYMTYSKNSELMGQAFKLAKGTGENLSSDKMIAQVSAVLPGNRMGEFYIGTKGVMDLVLPFAAMAGVQVPADKIPENLPPIGGAISTHSGSAHFAIFVPAPVIKTVIEIGMAFQQQMDGGMGGQPEPAPAGGKGESGQPRF